ncbi:metallophosphoesterase [Bacillus suaedae]|uniref:Metallophosphoesterase n=1 Tax=Halalkalibacter suaedae TaxID=2822140 RepID=A0A940WYE9_9BACI|nr:metallophosphoesterase [Bacillus suaedae]MBP3953087.1 metallophosphoesterase [Bacillus suaedae]
MVVTIIKRMLMGAAALGLVLLVWGLVEPYFIDVNEEEATIENLPPEWEGKEVAVIGDMQVGMWMDNTNTISRISEDLAEMDPEAVLILGDFIYHPGENAETNLDKVKEVLRPLTETDIPVFAILGNHDYAMTKKTDKPNMKAANSVIQALEEMDITFLQNESVALQLNDAQEDGEPLYITGLGSEWPSNVDTEKALRDIPDNAAKIMMMHNPETFSKVPADTAPLAVAGHTHGGQVRIPFTPESSYLTFAKESEVHADGWIEDYGEKGNQLYVNPGIGFSHLPMRIMAPPQITLFTLSSS